LTDIQQELRILLFMTLFTKRFGVNSIAGTVIFARKSALIVTQSAIFAAFLKLLCNLEST